MCVCASIERQQARDADNVISWCVFSPHIARSCPQVDLNKVALQAMRPWVTNKITTMLGFEDDVVIEYVLNMLEVSVVRVVRDVRASVHTS